jgi:aryl-alcohol dehydrogenase-like predicted oxidoreductase
MPDRRGGLTISDSLVRVRAQFSETSQKAMHYRLLGKTNLRTSVIGLGTWQFGGEWGRAYTQREVDAVLDKAAECGINLIDTAECYGDHLSESLIGDYLSRHDRSRWIVATKFGHHFHGFMERSWAMKPDEVQQQLEGSLRALKTDYLDLYQFHSGSDPDFQQPDLWAMLQRQKQAGTIRHLGVSISSKAGPLQAREAASVGAEVLQVVYNRLEPRAEQDFFPSARQDQLGVLARVPLASGFLSGKYKAAGPFPLNDMRSTLEPAKVQHWIEEVRRIEQRELPPGIPMSAWALAWCLKNEVVSSVIPGCKDPGQVELNASAHTLCQPAASAY